MVIGIPYNISYVEVRGEHNVKGLKWYKYLWAHNLTW